MKKRVLLKILTLVLTSLTFIWTTSFSQTDYFRIEKSSNGQEFHFPIISSANKQVEEKINIHLQLGELDLIKGKEKKNIFENVVIDNGRIYGGKSSIEFKLLANNEKSLSIKFDESSCGATCTYWVRYYNFNPKNGDRYSLRDFFSNSNFEKFRNIIIPIRQQKIKTQIEQSGEDYNNLKSYIYLSIAEDDLDDFYFSSDTLFFDNENLLNKHDKFNDLEQITGIAIKSIEHLLNDFGKSALLTGNNLHDFQSTTEPQLYEGVIGGNSSFYLLIRNNYKNNFTGTYAYKKYGKAIYLEGVFEADIYSFKELNDESENVANLTFQKDKSNLTGYWQGKNGEKLIFKAERK